MNGFREYKVFNSTDDLAKYAGKIWASLQENYTKNGLFFVSSPLSSTPILLYKWLVQNCRFIKNWGKFRFILMDEQLDKEDNYRYIPLNDKASYENFARKNLLIPLSKKVKISVNKLILKPDLKNLTEFDKLIENHKGLDLLILAVGVKGHYAQVMPGTKINTGFHIAKLIPEFSQAHTKKGSKSYEEANFREYGMSLGPKQVISAKNIILIITGRNKKKLANQLFSYNSFDPDFPISIVHHNKIRYKTHIFLTKEVI